MIVSFLKHLLLLFITLFILTLVSYNILLKDPLNEVLATPHFYSGYFFYLQNLLNGDLGISYNAGEAVKNLIFAVLPPTLELCTMAMFLSLLLGLPLGFISSTNGHNFLGKTIKSIYVVGLSIPIFWIAPILLYFSAVNNWEISAIGPYNLLYEIKPLTGFSIIDVWFIDEPYKIKIIQNVLQHLALPTLVLTILPLMEIASFVQQRSDFLFTQNYIKISITHGWSNTKILYRYILPNTLPLLVPKIPRLFTIIVAQCMLIEGTFGWPGIGRWIINAVNLQDYNSISAGVIVIGLCIAIVNLFTEILIFILDPFNKKGWYAR
ncbi:cationic peptide transport system permease protein [Bisgaardia hudsonensis]|uniref:Cationic peptide transport system permease protein n=1 Tax=Bisgaardia hudsonensis TaxID=109472 RepID=A0A4R2N3G7_9PAST|nr:ABC transporter permease subunit [Bisgaardia hudsonensis]QLB12821.1 peptide ABC transporter permease [Bisgaardia hudsonensis]TCP14379.1 cationic peptide transport system permease protein [Bisgaardia hudsonensis]